MDHKELIIDSPDLQLATPRRSWAFVKSLGWLLWFMLWLPLLTLLGWYFGYETIVEQFVDRKGSIELVRLLPTYLLVIGVCGGSLVVWSLIEYWRFRRRARRNPIPNMGNQALAEMTHSSVEAVQSWQNARRVVAYHDASAKIVTVDTDPNALYGKALAAAVAAAEAAGAAAEVANAATEVAAKKEEDMTATLTVRAEPVALATPVEHISDNASIVANTSAIEVDITTDTSTSAHTSVPHLTREEITSPEPALPVKKRAKSRKKKKQPEIEKIALNDTMDYLLKGARDK
jgi:poly-beta-1,6-N-acetyl-D-glucosamine biosynthesis protein PgaD